MSPVIPARQTGKAVVNVPPFSVGLPERFTDAHVPAFMVPPTNVAPEAEPAFAVQLVNVQVEAPVLAKLVERIELTATIVLPPVHPLPAGVDTCQPDEPHV